MGENNEIISNELKLNTDNTEKESLINYNNEISLCFINQ